MFFWALQLFIVTIYIGYTPLFYLAAMARVTFASDNRSTKIRSWLLVIQTLAICWGMWTWLATEEEEFLQYILLPWAGFHWWLMGALMVGESSILSPRTRRELPSTYFSRMFLTWLNPGPGTGFMFTFLNVFSLAVLIILTTIVSNAFGFGGRLDEEQVLMAIFVFCYLVNYLGLTRLVMIVMDRFVHGGIFLSALLSILFVLFGSFLPFLFQGFLMWAFDENWNYTFLQTPNPFWDNH